MTENHSYSRVRYEAKDQTKKECQPNHFYSMRIFFLTRFSTYSKRCSAFFIRDFFFCCSFLVHNSKYHLKRCKHKFLIKPHATFSNLNEIINCENICKWNFEGQPMASESAHAQAQKNEKNLLLWLSKEFI